TDHGGCVTLSRHRSNSFTIWSCPFTCQEIQYVNVVNFLAKSLPDVSNLGIKDEKKSSGTIWDDNSKSNATSEKLEKVGLLSFKANQELIPSILTLALNDSMTYDKPTKTGGPNGSIRFRPENKGLSAALSLVEEAKKEIDSYSKGGPISYSDLIQLAGLSLRGVAVLHLFVIASTFKTTLGWPSGKRACDHHTKM
nr:thylakoid lumenal 29 kDa protein, chloroplastic [Tanacetum cinerariifolium]